MAYTIAVLMGGSSFEREFSLESGQHVTNTLRELGHTVLPLDTGASLVETLRTQHIDCVYIALHGKGGEDGTIQALLEYLDVPFVGSSSQVTRMLWNKSALPNRVLAARSLLRAAEATNAAASSNAAAPGAPAGAGSAGSSANVPANAPANANRAAEAANATHAGPACWPASVSLAALSFKDLGAAAALDLVPSHLGNPPWAAKPARGGSAMGISRVDAPEQLGAAILHALSFDSAVILQQWVKGVELAVGVIGNGAGARVLPPVEIAPKRGFFDTEARQDAELVEYYCPVRAASFAPSATAALERIEQAALEIHQLLGCRDLSRIDLIWDGSVPRVLEVNVSPGMTEHSLIPMACAATTDISFGALLETLIDTAIKRG